MTRSRTEIVPSVMVAVHGRWHAFELARSLEASGMLSTIATTYPRGFTRRVVGSGVNVKSAVGLELRRRVYDKFKLGTPPDFHIATTFAKFASRHLNPNANILVGWSAATLEAIPAAHKLGMKVALERGSTHIGHQRDVLAGAYDELGIRGDLPANNIVARELEEYRLADTVFVPTQYAKQTFIDRGVSAEKIVVNPYGVDLSQYSMIDRSGRPGPIEVLLVGGVGVRKGVPWLIQAFGQLDVSARLRFVGPVDRRMHSYAERFPSAQIEFTGPLSGDDLVDAYRRADVFCLPSIEEGFPLAMLEAMATGLPVVTTPAASGGVIEDGRNGVVVPARDIGALANALYKILADEPLRLGVGAVNRELTEKAYSWYDYGRRAEAAYRAMLN